MISHEVSVHLNRPVEQVFAFLADPGKLPMWQSNLIKTEQLTEGPLRLGSRFREVRMIRNKAQEVQGEVTAFDPNKRLATQTVEKPRVSISYSFQPEDGGTRLSYKFVMQTGGLMRLFEAPIRSAIEKQSGSDFERLKHLLET